MTASAPSASGKPDMKLFWACFIALVATSFVFGIRATLMGDIADALKLTDEQKGVIFGVGLWPFAISIILFSFIVDRIGYKTVAAFAIVCHVVSIALTVTATGYQALYWGTFLISIANGMVECFINPVVATVFSKQKAKWLNILHAGWPAGMVLGALTNIALRGHMDWHVIYGMCAVPVVVYTILLLPQKFPVNERVAAGVSFRDMLKEVGAVGFFIFGALVAAGITQLIRISSTTEALETAESSLAFLKLAGCVGLVAGVLGGLYTRSLGNGLFLVVLLTMGPLATTELGTDSWMNDLLEGDLGKWAAWVFVMVSIIMTILRFFAGPIVHRFSPIGLLVVSAATASIGLLLLSSVPVSLIVVVAVLYAIGKTFLWSTTLGMVSEQFPRGGALTLNGVSAVGVLGLGIFGSPLMGWFQDRNIDTELRTQHPAIYAKVQAPSKYTLFGEDPVRNEAMVKALPKEEKDQLDAIVTHEKRMVFARQAVLPAFMLLCYLGIFAYFKLRGGYRPVELGHAEEAEPGF